MATEQYYIWYEMVMVQIHMERNGYGEKYIWYEKTMVLNGYGTKWLAWVVIRLRGTMNLLVLKNLLFHTLSLSRVFITWTNIF